MNEETGSFRRTVIRAECGADIDLGDDTTWVLNCDRALDHDGPHTAEGETPQEVSITVTWT